MRGEVAHSDYLSPFALFCEKLSRSHGGLDNACPSLHSTIESGNAKQLLPPHLPATSALNPHIPIPEATPSPTANRQPRISLSPSKLSNGAAPSVAPLDSFSASRLDLRPKRVDGQGRKAGVIIGVDPEPDWSLDELTREIDLLASISPQHFSQQRLPSDRHVSPGTKLVSWRPLLVTAHFQQERRGGFRMALSDEDDEGDDDVDGSPAGVLSVGGHNPGERAAPASKSSSPSFQEPSWELISTPSPPTSTPPRLSPAFRPRRGEEAGREEEERQRQEKVKEEVRRQAVRLEAELAKVREEWPAVVACIRAEEANSREKLRRDDLRDLRTIAEVREEYLSDIQRAFEQRTEVGERALRRDAEREASRKEKERQLAAERAQREADQKAKEEASRKEAQAAQTRQLAEGEEAERRRKEVEEGAKVAMEEEATRQGSAVVKGEEVDGQKDLGGEAGFGVQGERFRMVKRGRSLVGRRGGRGGGGPGGGSSRNRSTAETGHLPGSFQGERKKAVRMLKMLLRQISRSAEQINKISKSLMQILMESREAHSFMVLALADEVIRYLENLEREAPYALAKVLVNISGPAPDFLPILLGRLHQESPLTVPKRVRYIPAKFASREEYLCASGHREGESSENYLERASKYVALLAALSQTSVRQGSAAFGVSEGWAYCARLINLSNPNLNSATALYEFLNVGGYELHVVYKRAFQKMLETMWREYLPKLTHPNTEDMRRRLESYIQEQRFGKEPEGKKFVLEVESNYEVA